MHAAAQDLIGPRRCRVCQLFGRELRLHDFFPFVGPLLGLKSAISAHQARIKNRLWVKFGAQTG